MCNHFMYRQIYKNIYKHTFIYFKMEEVITSLRCKQSTIEKLRELEVHPRETHEEIILRLIVIHKERTKK